MGTANDYNAQAPNQEPATKVGVMVRLELEDAAPVYGPGSQVGWRVYPPAGAISANPADILTDTVLPSGLRQGCCGVDGQDGPNISCICGAVLGTEWGDCWTQAEFRFAPSAITEGE